ncbi:hypothetical protein CSUI_003423 [Cystoisospora suis]|uniref:Uncharacterized protein n=1 Tax=Cystoisospora suis TaxID=483139 RepID=A0A2C6L2L3_9APIC|nr:hypothetical protein CSUI_003423 [Cystoisospora suis]
MTAVDSFSQGRDLLGGSSHSSSCRHPTPGSSSVIVSEWLAHKLIRQYLEGFSESSWPAVVKWTFVLGVLALRNSNLPLHKLSVNDLVDIVNQNGYSTMTPAQRLAPLQWAASSPSSTPSQQPRENVSSFSSSPSFSHSSSAASYPTPNNADRRNARSVSYDSSSASERRCATSSSPVLTRGRLRHQQRQRGHVSFRPSGLTPDSCFDFLLKSAAKKPSSHWRSGDPSTFLPTKRLGDPQYLDSSCRSPFSPGHHHLLPSSASSVTYPSWWGDGPLPLPQCTYFPKTGILAQKNGESKGEMREVHSLHRTHRCRETEETAQREEEEERASCISVATPKFGEAHSSSCSSSSSLYSLGDQRALKAGKENRENFFSPTTSAVSRSSSSVSSSSLLRGRPPQAADEKNHDVLSLPSFGMPSSSPRTSVLNEKDQVYKKGKKDLNGDKLLERGRDSSLSKDTSKLKTSLPSCQGKNERSLSRCRIGGVRGRGQGRTTKPSLSQKQTLLLRRRNLHRSPAPKVPCPPRVIDGFQSFRPTSEAQWVCTLRPSSHEHIKNPPPVVCMPRSPRLSSFSFSASSRLMNDAPFRQFAWRGRKGEEREGDTCFHSSHPQRREGGEQSEERDGGKKSSRWRGVADRDECTRQRKSGLLMKRNLLGHGGRGGKGGGGGEKRGDHEEEEERNLAFFSTDENLNSSLRNSGCSSYFQAALAAYSDEPLASPFDRSEGTPLLGSSGVHTPCPYRVGGGGGVAWDPSYDLKRRRKKHESLVDSHEYLASHPRREQDLLLFPDIPRQGGEEEQERFLGRQISRAFPSRCEMLFEESPYSLESYSCCYQGSEYSNCSSACSDSLSSLSFEPLRSFHHRHREGRLSPRSEAAKNRDLRHSSLEEKGGSLLPRDELPSVSLKERRRRSSGGRDIGDQREELILSATRSEDLTSPSLVNEEENPLGRVEGGGRTHHRESVEEAALRDSNLALSTSLVSESSLSRGPSLMGSPIHGSLQHSLRSLGRERKGDGEDFMGERRDREEDEGSLWDSEEASAVQDLIQMYWESDSNDNKIKKKKNKSSSSSPPIRICPDHPPEGVRGKLDHLHAEDKDEEEEESSYFESTHASCLPASMNHDDEGRCPSFSPESSTT